MSYKKLTKFFSTVSRIKKTAPRYAKSCSYFKLLFNLFISYYSATVSAVSAFSTATTGAGVEFFILP